MTARLGIPRSELPGSRLWSVIRPLENVMRLRRAHAAAGSDFPAGFTRRGLRGGTLPLLGPERTLRLEIRGGATVASAEYYRPLTRLKIVADGKAIAWADGGTQTRLSVAARSPGAAVWIAARVRAATEPDEPAIRAHTRMFFRDSAAALEKLRDRGAQ